MQCRRVVAGLLMGALLISVSGCQLLDDLLGPILNQAPVALCQASRTSGAAALTVTFDAAESYDPDGRIVKHEWAFGDGETGSGLQVSHTYQEPGRYQATLTVTDEYGASGRDQVEIQVAEASSGAVVPLMEHAIAKDVQDGSPVDRTQTFSRSDERAYVWFKVGPDRGQHTSSVEWYTPEGELYVTTTDQPSGFGDAGRWSSASLWHWIGLQTPQNNAASPPSAYPGTWQVQAHVDGERLFSDRFELQSEPSDGTGCVIWTQPPSVVEGATENNDKLYAFEEQVYRAGVGQAIDVDVAVDQLTLGSATFDEQADLVPGQLRGMAVYSYYVHFDPVGTSNSARVRCTVSFNEPIAGLILTDDNLDASDDTLGFSTRYPTGANARGVDLSIRDTVTLSADRRQLTVEFGASNAVDALRVVTLMGQLR